MITIHVLADEQVRHKWDAADEAVLTIGSGDTVVLWTRDVSDNGPDSDASVLANFDWDRAYPLAGPIAVHGAEPGDTLKVETLGMQGWGWTETIPGNGLLPRVEDAMFSCDDAHAAQGDGEVLTGGAPGMNGATATAARIPAAAGA